MRNRKLLLSFVLAVIFYLVFMKSRAKKIETEIGGINDAWDSLFIKYGKEFGVNPRLMKSIAANESYLGKFSGYEPIGGTSGLMHIKLSTARDYEPELTYYDLYASPAADENQIRTATKFMKDLLVTFNWDEKKAVQAYNAGEGNIKKGRIPSITAAYWDRYNRNYERVG